jgi:uncharacterized membrane-anchored protein YitT (DUF2179 family)
LERFRNPRNRVWAGIRFFGLILLGSAIFSLGFDLFLEPNRINTGGLTGVAQLLTSLLHWGSIGLISAILNVPLFLLGYRKLGGKFFFGSLLGMLAVSLFLELFSHIPAPETETLLGALYGGLMTGVGLGLVFLSGASTGGSDIVTRLLKKRFRGLGLGKLTLAVDLTVVTLTGIVFRDVNKALYSAVTLYVSSLVLDSVIYGLDYSAVALIITDHEAEVAKAIEVGLERGATVLQGRGAYTGRDKAVLLSAVRRRQVPELKDIVRDTDPNAFMILQEAHQVLGNGFKRYSDEL